MKAKLLVVLVGIALLSASGAISAQVPPRERPATQPLVRPQTSVPINPAQVRGLEEVRRQASQGNRRVRVIARLSTAAVAGAPATTNISPAAFTAPPPGLAAAQARLAARLAQLGVPHASGIDGLPLVVVEASAEELQQMIALGEVAEVVEDELAAPTLAGSTMLVRAPPPAPRSGGTRQPSITIAVLDTGVDSTHPFLAGRIVEEACYSSMSRVRNVSSLCPGFGTQSTAVGSAAPCTGIVGCDHGTHVAGIAAGRSTRQIPYNGVAPDVRIFPIQVFVRVADTRANGRPCERAGRASPCLLSYTSDQIRALQRVLDRRTTHNIVAVNMSLGGDPEFAPCDGDLRKPIIDELKAVGVLTVVASGNHGSRNQVSRPGCISTAVTVAATTIEDAIAPFSNRGKVDMWAPGVDIRSSIPGGGMSINSGTSMAAPHVAGAVAAVRARNPNASAAQVENWLKVSGTPTWGRMRLDVHSAARVHSLGDLSLVAGNFADIDAGRRTSRRSLRSDIWFKSEIGSDGYRRSHLVPHNGATLMRSQTAQHGGHLACSAGTTYSSDPLGISPNSYNHICIRTNEGRIGHLQPRSFSGDQVTISYLVWND